MVLLAVPVPVWALVAVAFWFVLYAALPVEKVTVELPVPLWFTELENEFRFTALVALLLVTGPLLVV